MTIRINTLNNHPIIEDSDNPGVPITNIYGNENADLVASNAAIIARAGLAFTYTGIPTVNDDVSGTAGKGSFGVPSFWTDSISGNVYTCTNNSVTGAVWNIVGSGGGGIATVNVDGVTITGDGDSNPLGTDTGNYPFITTINVDGVSITGDGVDSPLVVIGTGNFTGVIVDGTTITGDGLNSPLRSITHPVIVDSVSDIETELSNPNANIFIKPGVYDLSSLTGDITINDTAYITAAPGTVTLSGCDSLEVFMLATGATNFSCENINFIDNRRIVNIYNGAVGVGVPGNNLKLHFANNKGSGNNLHTIQSNTTAFVVSGIGARIVTGGLYDNDFYCDRTRFVNMQGVGFSNFHIERNKVSNTETATVWIGKKDNYTAWREGIWVCNNDFYDVRAKDNVDEAHHIFMLQCRKIFINNNKLEYVHPLEVTGLDPDHEAIYTKCSRQIIDGNIITNGGCNAITIKGSEESSIYFDPDWELTGAWITFGDHAVITNNIIVHQSGYIADHTVSGQYIGRGILVNAGGTILVDGNQIYNAQYGISVNQQLNNTHSGIPQSGGSFTFTNNLIKNSISRGFNFSPESTFSNFTLARNKIIEQKSGDGLYMRIGIDPEDKVDIYNWMIVDNEIHGHPNDLGANGISMSFESYTGNHYIHNVFVARNVITNMVAGIRRETVRGVTDYTGAINSEPGVPGYGAMFSGVNVGDVATQSGVGAYANQNYFYGCDNDYVGW